MCSEEQAECRAGLAREIEAWAPEARRLGDPWWPAVERVPAYFDALAALAGRPELNDTQRRIVRRVIKYLVSPLDLLPEFIYGPVGFREDVLLIALAARRLEDALGRDVLTGCGLPADDAGLVLARQRAAGDIDEDVREHLGLLLDADSVAGDEELAEDADCAGNPEGVGVQAARTEPHVMVFAGPGTGKTWRLEHELERLLVEERVDPAQVLVTTFTNKAADELRVRICDRFEAEKAFADLDPVLRALTISTIHSFCFRLIGEFHHHALFLKGAFSPMDDTQRMLFLFRYGIGPLQLKTIYPDWKTEQLALGGWHPLDLFHFYAYVGQLYDFLSEDVMRDGEVGLRHRYLQILQSEGGSVDECIIRTYPRYWKLVQEDGYLDNSMVLAYTEALLADAQVRRRVQARYRHLLVDEYQDTSPIQDRIFHAVTGRTGRLFAVGDDDQSIYAFRGADVRNATEFPKRWPGSRAEKLEQNRRSTVGLVAAGRALIEHNRTREPKALFTENPEGVPPWIVEAGADALPTAVAAALLRLRECSAIGRWDEVALLFRAITERTRNYMDAMAAQGIPSVLTGDRRFLRRPLVHGLMKVLKLIAGDEAKITNRVRAHRPFFDALGWSDRGAMLDEIREWHRKAHAGEYETLLGLFYAILNDTDAVRAEEHLADLGHLSGFIAAAEAQLTSPDLIKRLGYFLRYAEAAEGSFTGPAGPPQDAVQVMTIHKAKGLEFPVVVVADVVEGSIPADFPENVRTRLRRLLAGIEPHLVSMEEERRVLYVAMTRAERYVLLATEPGKRSPFLGEFPAAPFPGKLPAPVPAAAAHPARHVPPLHLSHGDVYNYHLCPRRYLLQDRYGFAGQVIAPLRAGQSLHRALEIYHRLRRDGEHVSADRRERIFERSWIRPRSSRDAKAEHDRLFGVFTRYVDGFERGDSGRIRVVATEQPFYVTEGRGVLTGKIDLVRERDDALEIVEFKFNRNPMMQDYPRLQLDHYSLAYPDEQPRLVVHYLKEDREDVMPTPQPEPVRQELDGIFRRIDHEHFDATPDRRKCRLCPVRPACAERR